MYLHHDRLSLRMHWPRLRPSMMPCRHSSPGWPRLRRPWTTASLLALYWTPSTSRLQNTRWARVSIDHMHMTSQKGAPVVLGVKRGTPRAPSPSMHSEGKPLHASPPSWPGCAHWLRGWAPMRSASKTCARSVTSLDPQHGVVVMETWRQCIRSIQSNSNAACHRK